MKKLLFLFFFCFINITEAKEPFKIKVTEKIIYPQIARQTRMQDDFGLIVQVWNGKIQTIDYSADSNPNSLFKNEIEKIKQWKFNTDGEYTIGIWFKLDKRSTKYKNPKTSMKIRKEKGNKIIIEVRSFPPNITVNETIIGIPAQ